MTASVAAASASGGEAGSGGREGAFGGNRVLADLLLASGRQDQAAFAQLYQLTSPWIYYLLRRRTGPTTEAEDAVVVVYAGIWHRAAQFASSNQSALSWLTTMAYELADS